MIFFGWFGLGLGLVWFFNLSLVFWFLGFLVSWFSGLVESTFFFACWIFRFLKIKLLKIGMEF